MNSEQAAVIAVKGAREAGGILAARYGVNPEVLSDAGKDIKTGADLAAEECILKALRETGIPILSEEEGSSESVSPGDRKWIIDPLDGTFNFTCGFPMCCVSIALWNGMEPELGVIHDFVHERTYVGRVGQGAECNGDPVRVSGCSDVGKAVLSTGFPTGRDYGTGALSEFVGRVQRFKKIRMIGSAAMSLAQVGCGVFDAYCEEDIWLWDVAAGLAMVKAAGGTYAISEPRPSWKLDVFAHNGRLAESSTS